MSAGRVEYAASLSAIKEAAQRIAPYCHVTPVFTSSTVDSLLHKSVFFKCEVFQKGGAFKFRGACNSVFSLAEEEAQRGVVTHSSGNHAGAVALAAKLRGIPAHIVVPVGTPQCKLAAIETYSGRVVQCAATMDAREATCGRIQRETGAVFVAPYNYGPTICGQGTIALELLEQVQPALDAIIVPVSGGGMIAGIAMAAKSLQPDIVILAAEPTGSNDAADVAAAKQAGQLVPMAKPQTIADGLQGRLGDLTWPIVRDLVDGVITVSDQDIVAAMQICYERLKVVVEPSGAAGLAAAMSPQFLHHPQWQRLQRVGVILCGGNADLAAKGFWELWR
ncbi:hypothetical protein WJX72_006641 [[Myrmecia] bisecta]|uniref:Serine racemase n=1 Tax=[Myrmecia] bisecta TaxID=41462 RepID=A0AAW1QS48_9CHLO